MHSDPLLSVLLRGKPFARAQIRGGDAVPALSGETLLYPFRNGTLLVIRVTGLPHDGFFSFHIHAMGDCTMGGDIPFHCAGGHYNPLGAKHPDHAGDLPVLLAGDGNAFSAVYTVRFSPLDVVGRAVILHEQPDDYRTDPSGNAGTRIACGQIELV